jgi:DNA repair exonuclease SbcCD ATPase subunit
MKIIELRAENIKNLKAIEIHPNGDSVILEGKNGAGKSAVLDSIFMALTGKKIEQPIRNGEGHAEINVDLGEIRVKKTFTAKGEYLQVTSAEGASFKSPQGMLDKLLGQLSFDPLHFASTDSKTQRTMLAALVGLDFTELNKKRLELYNERTIKNREIKGGDPTKYRPDPLAPLPLESLVSAMEKPASDTPRQEISISDELAKVQGKEDLLRAYIDECSKIDLSNGRLDEARKNKIEALTNQIESDNTEINRLATEIEEMKKALNAKIEALESANLHLTRLSNDLDNAKAKEVIHQEYPSEPITEKEIAESRGALKEIEEKNKSIRKAIEYDKKMAELDAAKVVIQHLEDAMMKIDLEKENRVKSATFPIEGLGLTDEYVTFNGKPFSQLSTGEQIRVSTAVAMALNPQLKIILVREGSLLDEAGLGAITELAKEKEYQLWIERVSDKKQVGIYLEDGTIQEATK